MAAVAAPPGAMASTFALALTLDVRALHNSTSMLFSFSKLGTGANWLALLSLANRPLVKPLLPRLDRTATLVAALEGLGENSPNPLVAVNADRTPMEIGLGAPTPNGDDATTATADTKCISCNIFRLFIVFTIYKMVSMFQMDVLTTTKVAGYELIDALSSFSRQGQRTHCEKIFLRSR